MRIETLNDRIANAKAKIEKKQGTILKKEALIEKKSNMPNADYWTKYEIEHLKEDVERLHSEIEEAKKSLEKYEAQLAGELEKESILIRDIPESMKRMQSELVERWDKWDIAYREKIKKDRFDMTYEDWSKLYKSIDRYTLMYRTDEQIHKANMQDAKMLIIDLYYRVKKITGEITDWSGIRATQGTWGAAVLNGFVIGKEGRAYVESILAGGYNIQRLHVRVLVHER